MKLLIIAGPYEADRLRKAATSAGFETVVVEPGESLSGWISASRPDLIVMAPKIVNPDPTVALGKVRAEPRGRVPIFFVGDPADEPRLRGLADAFFVRPVSPADLIAEAWSLLGATRSAPPGLGGGAESSGPHTLKTPRNLKPLVAESDGTTLPRAPRVPLPRDPFLMNLDESIDAALDADIRAAIRHVGHRERSGTPVGRPRHATVDLALGSSAGAPAIGSPNQGSGDSNGADHALAELRDESSQKTLEVPREVVARMVSAELEGLVAGGSSDRRRHAAAVPAPSESGDLAQQDVAWLLGRCYVERLTGWLTFKRDDIEKAIVFEAGVPILAGSNLPADRMGDMLVRQGRLTPEQRTKSGELLVSSDRRLGVVLVDNGFIKAGELAPLVRCHFEEIIFSLFAWESGDWAMSPDRPEEGETVLLTEHPAALILEGIRRKYGLERLRARVRGGQTILRVSKESGLSALLDEMAASNEEQRVVSLFDGVRPLDDLVAHAGADEATLLTMAWTLLALRRLSPVFASAERAASGGSGAPGSDDPNGGAGERDRERERDREIDRGRILARYALVREGDYFQVLGVSRQASVHEIGRAQQSLARVFARHALAPELVAEMAGPLDAIHAVIGEAARVLGDARLRRRYQMNLQAPSQAAET